MTQFQGFNVALRQPRQGGAACRGSSHVSTILAFYYIFNSRDSWVGKLKWQRSLKWEMSGGLGGMRCVGGRRRETMSCSFLCSWSFIHHTTLEYVIYVVKKLEYSLFTQSFSEMSFQMDAPIHVSYWCVACACVCVWQQQRMEACRNLESSYSKLGLQCSLHRMVCM